MRLFLPENQKNAGIIEIRRKKTSRENDAKTKKLAEMDKNAISYLFPLPNKKKRENKAIKKMENSYVPREYTDSQLYGMNM